MDTIMEKRESLDEVDGLPGHGPKPARWSAQRLAGIEKQIAAYIRRQPDITLGEIGAALVGASFTWAEDGKLSYAPRQVALIEEVEALIEVHGWATRAAELSL